MENKRLDLALIELGLVSTRSQAKLLITEEKVLVNKNVEKRTSYKVKASDKVEIIEQNPFVSRGAYKIERAIDYFNIDPSGMIVADIGASTGGFTDYLLAKGATKVFAIDVGHGQLSPKLIQDSRVENLEGVNIRYGFCLQDPVDLCVVDLSFISLKLTLENIFSLAKEQGIIVTLVKPQFEVGKEHIGKNGLVKNKKIHLDMLTNLADWCEQRNMFIRDAILSPIKGKTGNSEYLFYFDKAMVNGLDLSEKFNELVMLA